MMRFIGTLAVAALTAAAIAWWIPSRVDQEPHLRKPVPLVSVWVVEDELALGPSLFEETGRLDPALQGNAAEFQVTHYFNEMGTQHWSDFARGNEGAPLIFARDQVTLGESYIGSLNPTYTINMRFNRTRLSAEDTQQINSAWHDGNVRPENVISVFRIGETFDLTPQRVANVRVNDKGSSFNYIIRCFFTPQGDQEFWSFLHRNRGHSIIIRFGDRMISWPIKLHKYEGMDISDVGYDSVVAEGDFDEDFGREDFETLKRVYAAFLDSTPADLPFDDAEEGE